MKTNAGFVASPALARTRAQPAAARLVNSDAAAVVGRNVRGARSGVLMAAPEDTPEGPETYTLVVVR